MNDVIVWLPFLTDGYWTESVMDYCKNLFKDHVSFSSSPPNRPDQVLVVVPECWRDSPYLRDFINYGRERNWGCFIFGGKGILVLIDGECKDIQP